MDALASDAQERRIGRRPCTSSAMMRSPGDGPTDRLQTTGEDAGGGGRAILMGEDLSER
jgi:hypothetical protein